MTIAFNQTTICPSCGKVHTADMPFGRWLRSKGRNGGPLPSSLFVASDCDFILHRYKTEVDKFGSREFQHIGIVEAKSFKSHVNSSQLDTLSKLHTRLYGRGETEEYKNICVRHWGVAVLRLERDTPSNGRMIWSHLSDSKEVEIDEQVLIELLSFERHWKNRSFYPVRRHHKTDSYKTLEQMPLGFTVDKLITNRS